MTQPLPEIPIATGSQPSWATLARTHYENFPVGSWLLPRAARAHLHRIYAFARTADDLADEHRDAAALASFRSSFLDHLSGRAADVALFRDLVDSMRACELEQRLFTDLLDAFAQDLTVRRYDLPALLDYCRRSADPVGRLVLRVCGHRDAALDSLSDRICTALQLLNHLQDMGADLRERDRIYFPAADLQRYGVSEEQLRAAQASTGLRALAMEWVQRLRAEFAAGWELTERVRGRLRLELRAILRGASAVLDRIEQAGGDVLAGKVRLTRGQRIGCVLGALLPVAPRSLRRTAA